MKLIMNIAESTLGENSHAENLRYASAVFCALAETFTEADVEVDIVADDADACCVVHGVDLMAESRIEAQAREIANEVWDRADY